MAKTCIRVEACNIGSSERHNLRSKELDYIRPELTHRNEQWVECSIAEVHRDITEKYKEATGQGLQKKATPIREGVIVISEETTIQQLQDLAEKLEERFGVHAFQIYTHKDEGAWAGKKTTDENGSVWQGTYKFNKNGTYTRTNIEIDKQGNKKEANIYGQWSFGDPSFSTIYFGGEHYWDIDELTKNKFSFYDRSGKFGDPFMNREYIELTPYQENNTTN